MVTLHRLYAQAYIKIEDLVKVQKKLLFLMELGARLLLLIVRAIQDFTYGLSKFVALVRLGERILSQQHTQLCIIKLHLIQQTVRMVLIMDGMSFMQVHYRQHQHLYKVIEQFPPHIPSHPYYLLIKAQDRCKWFIVKIPHL